SMKIFVEKTLPHIIDKQVIFPSLIQQLLENLLETPGSLFQSLADLKENLILVQSLNAQHAILEEPKFQELIKSSYQKGFENCLQKTVYPVTDSDQKTIVELISNIKGMVPLDEKSMIPLYLKNYDANFLFKNLMTTSFLSTNPDVCAIAL